MKKKILAWVAVGVMTFGTPGVSHATSVVSNINADNAFAFYLSTDNNTLGNYISSQSFDYPDSYRWNHTVTNTTALTSAPGQDYYLHIVGENDGQQAGFLGSFSLDGSGYKFSNGTTNLVTNTTDWKVTSSQNSSITYSTPSGSYVIPTLTPISYNANGTGPWGYQSAQQPTAEWIWNSTPGANGGNNTVFFSAKITANSPAPEPSTYALMGIGGLLIAFRMKKAGLAACRT